MNYLYLLAGSLIVLFVIKEVLVTTFAPGRTGRVSEKVRRGIWSFFLMLAQGDGSRKMLDYAGMFTVVAWLVGWLLTYRAGNVLIFMSDSTSILHSKTNAVTSGFEKAYFTGYVLSTMGLGDMIPNGSYWQLYTSVISFSGFVIISLSISYFVPVLSAVKYKRMTSLYISFLGSSPEEILRQGWNGSDFSRLIAHFQPLTWKILELSKDHLAYPVLYNFHSHVRRESIYVSIARLDEALIALSLHVPDHLQPAFTEIRPLQAALDNFLETVRTASFETPEESPAPVDTDRLAEAGIPLEKTAGREMKEAGSEIAERRKQLVAMVRNDGWKWTHLRPADHDK